MLVRAFIVLLAIHTCIILSINFPPFSIITVGSMSPLAKGLEARIDYLNFERWRDCLKKKALRGGWLCRGFAWLAPLHLPHRR